MSAEHKYSREGKTSEKELLKCIFHKDLGRKKHRNSYHNLSGCKRQKNDSHSY